MLFYQGVNNMEFELRTFLKQSLLDMVGYRPDREIKYAASRWFDKGSLFEEDLAEIETAINNQHTVEELIEGEV